MDLKFEQFKERYDFDNNQFLDRKGLGNVFKGTDTITGQVVALKRQEVSIAQSYTLIDEFKAAKSLSHPNLLNYINAYRFKIPLGVLEFGVMEFMNGGNLQGFLQKRPRRVVLEGVIQDVIEALKYLHDEGVVYQDLNPNNVLIRNDAKGKTAKLINYGISKDLIHNPDLKAVLKPVIEFSSPEILEKKPLTKGTDIWSLGVLIYWLFTGKYPFGSRHANDTADDIKHNILSGEIPSSIFDIPQPYRAIVRDCLVKNPKERIQSVDELLWQLGNTKNKITGEYHQQFDNKQTQKQEDKPEEKPYREPLVFEGTIETLPLETRVVRHSDKPLIIEKPKRKKRWILFFILGLMFLVLIGFFNFGQPITPPVPPPPLPPKPPIEHPIGDAKIQFHHESHDFGKVNKTDVLRHTFEFTNIGEVPLNIVKIINNSSVLGVDFDTKSYLPGESGVITVNYAVQDVKDNVTLQSFQVIANANPASTTLKLDAQISGEKLTIIGESVNVKDFPSVGGNVLFKLNSGNECELLKRGNKLGKEGEKEDYWYQIRHNGKEGWVFGGSTSRALPQ